MRAGYLSGMAVMVVVLVIAAGCTGTGGAGNQAPPTLVGAAAADGRLMAVVAAAQATGLTDTLNGPGPFTVFAPTDDAVAALPGGTLSALLADPEGLLTEILTYHVVNGTYMAADVVNLTSLPTVHGSSLTITVEGGTVMVDGAKILTTDIEASNGVIHVIDAVMLPPPCHLTIGTSPGAPAHQHVWCEGAKETLPFCNVLGVCHVHQVNETENLAEAAGAGPHTHPLT